MVLIWNDLACGDREAAALLVAINSVFQIVAYSAARHVLPRAPARLARPGHPGRVSSSTWEITKVVLVFLGIPLVAGYLTRRIGLRTQGQRLVRARRSSRASARSRCTACSSPSS